MAHRLLFSRLDVGGPPAERMTPFQMTALARFLSKLKSGTYVLENATCVCGERGGLLVARRDRYGIPNDTLLCQVCGTLRSDPRLDAASLRGFYDDDYRAIYVGEEWAPDDFFARQRVQGRSVMSFVQEAVRLGPGSRVFDIGCGAGGLLIPFRECGCAVFGCDWGARYLERGRREGLTLEQGGAASLARHGKAHLVILSHVIEHFRDPVAELRAISGLLEDGGAVYVEVPGVFAMHRVYRDFLLYLQNAHLHHFTLVTLAEVARRAGFDLVMGDDSVRVVLLPNPAARPQGSAHEAARVLRYLRAREFLSRVGLGGLDRGAVLDQARHSLSAAKAKLFRLFRLSALKARLFRLFRPSGGPSR